MNKGITVGELFVLCVKELEKGNGDKHILISDDDEGNGYHTLFYGFTSDEKEVRMLAEGYTHDGNNLSEVVILG